MFLQKNHKLVAIWLNGLKEVLTLYGLMLELH